MTDWAYEVLHVALLMALAERQGYTLFISGFHTMKWLEILLLPPGFRAVSLALQTICQQAFKVQSGDRDAALECLTKEHNMVTLVKDGIQN